MTDLAEGMLALDGASSLLAKSRLHLESLGRNARGVR
jgi:hypothetical protein